MAPSNQRRNGFSRPFATLQIATWVALPVLVLSFLLFCSPVLPLEASIPVTLVHFTVACLATFYAYLACVTDPMDVHLALDLYRTTNNDDNSNAFANALDTTAYPKTPPSTLWYRPPDFSKLPSVSNEPLKYCWVCETSVAEHSMHCKYCNKCVSQFDHHCQWLNTCVGEGNYHFFYYALWLLCSMLLIQLGVLLGLIVDYFLDGSTLDRAKDWIEEAAALAAIWIFFAIFVSISLFLMGQLLWFHIQLRRENLSTYKFILRDSARKRDKAKQDVERAGERSRAVQDAQSHGRGLLATRLELGKYCCVLCDPLPPTVMEEDDKNESHSQSPSEPNGNSNGLVTKGEDNYKDSPTKDGDEEKLGPKTRTSSSSLSELEGERSLASNGGGPFRSAQEAHATMKEDAAQEEPEKEDLQQSIVWEKI